DVEGGIGERREAAGGGAVAGGEITQGGGQPGADAVSLEVLRDGGVVELATAGAGSVVPLVFGDERRQLGQLRDLMPGGLGVVQPGVRRERRMRARSVAGRARGGGV